MVNVLAILITTVIVLTNPCLMIASERRTGGASSTAIATISTEEPAPLVLADGSLVLYTPEPSLYTYANAFSHNKIQVNNYIDLAQAVDLIEEALKKNLIRPEQRYDFDMLHDALQAAMINPSPTTGKHFVYDWLKLETFTGSSSAYSDICSNIFVLIKADKYWKLDLTADKYSNLFFYAASFGEKKGVKITQFLLSLGAPVDRPFAVWVPGFTPLHNAVTCRNVPVVKLLLEAGANPNTCTSGTSILHKNCINEIHTLRRYPGAHLEIARLLLAHGATASLKMISEKNSPAMKELVIDAVEKAPERKKF